MRALHESFARVFPLTVDARSQITAQQQLACAKRQLFQTQNDQASQKDAVLSGMTLLLDGICVIQEDLRDLQGLPVPGEHLDSLQSKLSDATKEKRDLADELKDLQEVRLKIACSICTVTGRLRAM